MLEAGLRGLLLQTLTLSLAVVAVRLLQATLLRRLGAAAAYLCWLLVPVAMLAVVLPHPAVDALVVRVDVSAVTPAWVAAPAHASAGHRGAAVLALGVAWATAWRCSTRQPVSTPRSASFQRASVFKKA